MDTELSVSEIGSRSRDRSISLAVIDVNLTHAGELDGGVGVGGVSRFEPAAPLVCIPSNATGTPQMRKDHFSTPATSIGNKLIFTKSCGMAQMSKSAAYRIPVQITGAAASQCVTPRGVRQFWGL